MKSLKRKINPALFCFGCEEDIETLKTKNISCIRITNNENSKIVMCAKCIRDLNYKVNPISDNSNNKIYKKTEIIDTNDNITPEYLYSLLNQAVIGQDEAKKAISLAVASHLKRQSNPLIGKSNILLLGPTGTGKTELARAISSILNLPLVIGDATTFTQHGYTGSDVESLLTQLIHKANGKISLAEKGIIFIDEIDKIATQDQEQYHINTTAVQQNLLKMMEGGQVIIPKNMNNKDLKDNKETITIDTSKILFICAGAFSGLDKIIKSDFKINNAIGLAPKKLKDSLQSIDEQNIFSLVSEKHLIRYGFIPEFLGRFGVFTSTKNLNKDDLIKIMRDPNNSLEKQYVSLMDSYNIILEFDDSFFDNIATKAIESGLGARSIRKEIETALKDLLFYAPSAGYNYYKVFSSKTIKKKIKAQINQSITIN